MSLVFLAYRLQMPTPNFLFMKLTVLVSVVALLPVLTADAQALRDTPRLPSLPGFHTLKGDFHLHTVFSDGQVWPSFRVTEAVRDGLDFIAITDHIDYQGAPNQADREELLAPFIEAKKQGAFIVYNHPAYFYDG